MNRDIRADYLRDPRMSMFDRMIRQGTSSQPVQSWAQGLANLGSALTGAYMAKKLRGEYEGKEKEAGMESESALQFAFGRPAETQKYGDTTINWSEQAPNMAAAVQQLKSPYNKDLKTALLNQQFNQQQSQAEMAQKQQQQEAMFKQQRDLLAARGQQERELAQWKMQQDPINQILMGGQSQRVSYPVQGGLAPQTAPPTVGQVTGQGQASSMPPAGSQQPSTQMGISAQDAMYNAALGQKGIKAPEGYMYGAPTQAGGQPRLLRIPKSSSETTFSKEMAKKDAQLVSKTREDLGNLGAFRTTIDSAINNLEKVPSLKLGPIAGRISQMSGDPQVANLTSDLNTLALQSRTLLNLPASGFSDADREFLVAVAGGSAFQKDALGNILTKLKSINEKAARNKQGLIDYAESRGTLTGYKQPTEQVKEVGWDDELTSGETVKLPDGRIVTVP